MTTNDRNRDRLYCLVIALQLGVILLVTTAYGGEHRRVLQWNEVGERLKAEMARCKYADPTERPEWDGDWCSKMNQTSITRPLDLIATYQVNREFTSTFAANKFYSLISDCRMLAKEQEALKTHAERRARMWEERARLAERRLRSLETTRERAGSSR